MTTSDATGNTAPQAHDSSGGVPVGTHMKITWRTVAFVAVIVMTGLLITLIVVSTNLGVDALATTALALAVIAFSAQLIVYVAQVADSSETRRQSLEVNAATQASLARIGTTVASSDQLLRDQHSQLLGQVIGDLRRAGIQSKESDSTLGFGDAVELLESQVGNHMPSPSTVDDDESDDYDVELRPSIFDLWPRADEMAEARRVHSLLRELDPIAVAQIIRFADDEKFSDALSVDPGLIYFDPVESPFCSALLDRGLVERTGRHPRHGRWMDPRPEFVALTDLGKMAARLLCPKGAAPSHVRELARWQETSDGALV